MEEKTIQEMCQELIEVVKTLRHDLQQEKEKQKMEVGRPPNKASSQKKRKQQMDFIGKKEGRMKPEQKKNINNQLRQGVNRKVGDQVGEIIKNLKRKKRKGERGGEGSYKVRYKKEKEEINGNNKENG